MAKMFYTLEEAAEKLGIDEQAVKDMAAGGQLQQFRDRDKLMFKREQVDALAASGGSAGDSAGIIPLADSSSDTDAIDLKEDSAGPKGADPREATGISVFDAGEVDAADPMAQTQVTSPVGDDEELALESVGSGSGLLDLTRESDDTSLGAELLDEIYPGTGEASDAKLDSAVGSSGVFEGASAMETGASGPSGLENLSGAAATGAAPAAAPTGAPLAAASYEPDAYDPAGSGFGAGMLIGALVALIVGLIVTVSALNGVPSPITEAMAGSTSSLALWAGGLLVLSLVLGVVGLVIGKATAR